MAFNFKINNKILIYMLLIVQPKGGFGNILFIIANGIALSKKNNMYLAINSEYEDKRKNVKEYKFFNNMKYIKKSDIVIKNKINYFNENGFQFQDIKLKKHYINIIDGYFQSFRYFNEYINEIKDLLYKNIELELNEMKELYNNITNNNKTIMIHMRRGDYVNLQHVHPVQTDEYYLKGIDIIKENNKENYKLIIFSDDIEYCINNKMYENYDVYYVKEENVEKSFLLMTFCDNFIISNSSLSLLAYYFRDNKDAKLVAPNNWFGEYGPKIKKEDLFYEDTNLL